MENRWGEMATHSSILAWRIPWTKELGRLQSMGSQRVGHNWATSLSLSLLTIWWCPYVELSLVLLKEGAFAVTSVFSWQNSVSLCPASFCTPRPNLPVTPDISWLPTFAFQSPMMKRTSFFGVSSRRSCRSSWYHSSSASSPLVVGA